jgi:DNA-binding transcriptional MerR regulator
MSEPRKVISTKELSLECGLTLRQLQWLDEQNLVVPQRGWLPGSRHSRPDSRLYGADHRKRLKILGELRHKGLSLRAASRVLEACWDTVSRAKRSVYVIVDAREAVGHVNAKGNQDIAKVVFGDKEVLREVCAVQHGTILLKIVH